MAKRKNKANDKIEELTDLLKGMSPTQLATLEGFIAGNQQGENVRGLQDYENTAAAAPGLGVATAAPATAFGSLPTLSDTSARAGLNLRFIMIGSSRQDSNLLFCLV